MAAVPLGRRSPEWPDGMERLIFISYRKALSKADARLLYAKLDNRFEGQVFYDTESLLGGKKWADELDRALHAPGLRVVVFIVAKDTWEHSNPGESTPRLWHRDDVVLRELEIALERMDAHDEDDLFELILAPETRDCTVPREEIVRPGIPERTQKILERISDIHMDSEHELATTAGLKALVEHVDNTVRELGARRNADVWTWADLAEKRGPNATVLFNGLQKLFDEGHRDTWLVAQLAALMVVNGKYAAACERLRNHFRQENEAPADIGGEQDPDNQYWRAFAALALARGELRDQRPRKLPSLRLARELARDVLLPALEALEGKPEASTLHRDLARTLDAILTDYFGTRGIKISPDGWAEDHRLPVHERLVPRIHRQLSYLDLESAPESDPRGIEAGPPVEQTGPSNSERNVWQ